MNEKLRRDLKEAQETVEALMTELEEASESDRLFLCREIPLLPWFGIAHAAPLSGLRDGNAEESKSVAEQAVTENKEDWSSLGEAYKDASW